MHGDFPEDLSKERESSYKVRLSDFLALKLKDNAAKINKNVNYHFSFPMVQKQFVKNDFQLRILYSAKPSLKCKRRIKTFSEIQSLKKSHLFPRVPHQNKKETKDPGSKGWKPSGEVVGRPRMPDPEQNLFLDTEKATGGQGRAEGSPEQPNA